MGVLEFLHGNAMLRYGLTIFLSAFLLFQIQPIVAKFILPWFGGTSTVWTTCMMFFQVFLLLGYFYAHLLRRLFTPRLAWSVHLGLLVAASLVAVWLRAIPPDSLKPDGGENLTFAIVKLLTITLGLPFLVLASTGPLVQAWHSISHGGRTYRLYAVSNLGSMLALLTYPFLFERIFRLYDQANIWTGGFILFAVLCAASGWQTAGRTSWVGSTPSDEIENSKFYEINGFRILIWIVLAMSPSIMMMATTNLMCQEVASIPFLWILPLSLYLVSLIICFDRPAIYRRIVFTPLLIASSVIAVLIVHAGNQLSLLPQVLGLAVVCFSCSMCCHGELERCKPPTRHLTLYYLMVAVGGALGGLFVVAVAPRIFVEFNEFHVGLLASLGIVLTTTLVDARAASARRTFSVWATSLGTVIAIACVICSFIFLIDPGFHPGLLARERNEYGLVQVFEKPLCEWDKSLSSERDELYRVMINGRTVHGGQLVKGPDKMKPSGYYVQGSGPSLAIEVLRADPARKGQGLNIGVIGLGTGSLVTWGQPQDRFWFYEINPLSDRLAREYFTYLDESKNQCQVIIGDGRIQLERQLSQVGPLEFDVLFMDAFTSDSIPVHLMTRESFKLYWQHLRDDGILVAHITNRFVDLRPVVYSLAVESGYTPILIEHAVGTQYQTRWVLITKNQRVLESELITSARLPWPEKMRSIVWTDDFASLAQVVDWSFSLDWNIDAVAEQPQRTERKPAIGEQESAETTSPDSDPVN
jgi:hypothetical protein